MGGISDDTLSTRARRLAMTLEPFAGQVYFSPECHAEYEALGFSGSPKTTKSGVRLPDGAAYFTSRGSVMGQVAGHVVAAAFSVFNPDAAIPAVAFGWTLTDAATIEAARTRGAIAQLVRILGSDPAGVERARDLLARANEPLRPEGRPLFAGMCSVGLPGDPVGDAWRLADRLREFRGDAHTAAWTSAGFDAAEIGLVSEQWWGLAARTYVRTRAWTDDQLDAAAERLRSRGVLDGDALTPAGREAREGVETSTDRQMRPAIEMLGDDIDELIATVAEWGAAIRVAAGYLPSGPHELAASASR